MGLLGLADMPRASAKPMIDRLHPLGLRRVVMLTDDQRPSAEAIAKTVGIAMGAFGSDIAIGTRIWR